MTFVLIPGAGGAASQWSRLEKVLRRRGHDALAVDLPTDDDSAGLVEYAAAVVAAIGDRGDVILVAQSMGSFTALRVCQRIPVRMLVLLNPMIPAAGETAGDWWANTGHAEARRANDVREGRDPDAPFDPFVVFLHDVPPEVLANAEEPRRQSNTPFGSPSTLVAWPDVPTRVLVGADDRFFPAEFQRRLARERLHLTPDEIPGGHLVALSHPEAVADKLETYQAELTLHGS